MNKKMLTEQNEGGRR